jgi:allantoicase
MHDGWESRRRRGPGHDQADVRLGIAGRVRAVEVDTSFFRGNFPTAVAVELRDVSAGPDAPWVEVVPETPTQAHTRHVLELQSPTHATHARLRIHPDGGVARLRVYGLPDPADWLDAGARRLSGLAPGALETGLRRCCESARWVHGMVRAGPFWTWAEVLAAATRVEATLGLEDWLEAFAAHPAIGEQRPESDTARWSAGEQAGMRDADEALRLRIAAGNGEYRERFGYTYIVCATGRSAADMWGLLQTRLEHSPEVELAAAAEQQALITRIRLEKLVLP